MPDPVPAAPAMDPFDLIVQHGLAEKVFDSTDTPDVAYQKIKGMVGNDPRGEWLAQGVRSKVAQGWIANNADRNADVPNIVSRAAARGNEEGIRSGPLANVIGGARDVMGGLGSGVQSAAAGFMGFAAPEADATRRAKQTIAENEATVQGLPTIPGAQMAGGLGAYAAGAALTAPLDPRLGLAGVGAGQGLSQAQDAGFGRFGQAIAGLGMGAAAAFVPGIGGDVAGRVAPALERALPLGVDRFAANAAGGVAEGAYLGAANTAATAAAGVPEAFGGNPHAWDPALQNAASIPAMALGGGLLRGAKVGGDLVKQDRYSRLPELDQEIAAASDAKRRSQGVQPSASQAFHPEAPEAPHPLAGELNIDPAAEAQLRSGLGDIKRQNALEDLTYQQRAEDEGARVATLGGDRMIHRNEGVRQAEATLPPFEVGNSPLGSHVDPTTGVPTVDARMPENVRPPLAALEKTEEAALNRGEAFPQAHTEGVAAQNAEASREGQSPAKVEGQIDATLRDKVYPNPKIGSQIDPRQAEPSAPEMPTAAGNAALRGANEVPRLGSGPDMVGGAKPAEPAMATPEAPANRPDATPANGAGPAAAPAPNPKVLARLKGMTLDTLIKTHDTWTTKAAKDVPGAAETLKAIQDEHYRRTQGGERSVEQRGPRAVPAPEAMKPAEEGVPSKTGSFWSMKRGTETVSGFATPEAARAWYEGKPAPTAAKPEAPAASKEIGSYSPDPSKAPVPITAEMKAAKARETVERAVRQSPDDLVHEMAQSKEPSLRKVALEELARRGKSQVEPPTAPEADVPTAPEGDTSEITGPETEPHPTAPDASPEMPVREPETPEDTRAGPPPEKPAERGVEAASRKFGSPTRGGFTLNPASLIMNSLPKALRSINAESDAHLRVEGGKIRRLWSNLHGAIRDEFGQTVTPQFKADLAKVAEGQSPQVPLPPKIAKAADALRSYINANQQELVNRKIFENAQDAHIGTWLNRSYKIHDEPTYEPSQTTVDNAVQGFMQKDPKLTQDQAREKVNQVLDAEKRIFGKGGGGIRDKILGARKDLPDFYRELLGEYKDPVVRMAKSAEKSMQLIVSKDRIDNIVAEGIHSFLFPTAEEAKGTGIAKPSRVSESEKYGALAGLWADPRVKQALEGHRTELPGWLEAVAKAGSWTKWAQTMGNLPVGAPRNLIGNMLLASSNGHIAPGKWATAVQDLTQHYTTKPGLLDEAIKYQVMEQGVNAGEVRALMKDVTANAADYSTPPQGVMGWAQRRWGNTKTAIERAYDLGDALPRLVGWEMEKARVQRLADARGVKLSPDEVKEAAAERVRNLYPTWSKLPEVVQNLRRIPFVGGFTGFISEVPRNTAWTVKYAMDEMAHPETRAIGARRAAGLLASMAAPVLIQQATAGATGLDDKKEKAARDSLRAQGNDWMADGTIAWHKDAQGKLHALSLSIVDPWSAQRDPLRSAMGGNVSGAVYDALKPYVGPSILSEAILDIARNQRGDMLKSLVTGDNTDRGHVWNPEDSGAGRAASAGGRLLKAFTPGVVRSAQSVISKGTQPLLTDYTVDPVKALQASARRYGEANKNAAMLVGSEKKAEGMAGVSDVNTVAKAHEAANEGDLRTAVDAARTLGVSENEITSIMRRGKVDTSAINRTASDQFPTGKSDEAFLANWRLQELETQLGTQTEPVQRLKTLPPAERAAFVAKNRDALQTAVRLEGRLEQVRRAMKVADKTPAALKVADRMLTQLEADYPAPATP